MPRQVKCRHTKAHCCNYLCLGKSCNKRTARDLQPIDRPEGPVSMSVLGKRQTRTQQLFLKLKLYEKVWKTKYHKCLRGWKQQSEMCRRSQITTNTKKSVSRIFQQIHLPALMHRANRDDIDVWLLFIWWAGWQTAVHTKTVTYKQNDIIP